MLPTPAGASTASRAVHRTRCGPARSDEVQVSAWSGHDVRDLRLHFVNTTGTATSIDRLRKTVRGAS